MEEENDVQLDSSLADAIEESIPDSSAGEETVSTEATVPEAETKEPPFHEHPRWKEVQEEKRQAQERADRLEQQLLSISERLSTPKDTTDPYADMDDEMKQWAKFIDQRAEAKARAIAEQERKSYMGEQQRTREQLAMIAYKEFQSRHPDVKPNSPEENAIAQRVKLGYTPDDAYEIVVGSTKRKSLEEELARERQVKQKAKTTQKLAANLETGGIGSNSPVQPQHKMSVAEFVEMQMKKDAVS